MPYSGQQQTTFGRHYDGPTRRGPARMAGRTMRRGTDDPEAATVLPGGGGLLLALTGSLLGVMLALFAHRLGAGPVLSLLTYLTSLPLTGLLAYALLRWRRGPSRKFSPGALRD